MKWIFYILFCLIGPMLPANEVFQNWNYQSLDYVKLYSLNGAEADMRVAPAVRTPEKEQTLAVTLKKLTPGKAVNIQLQYLYPGKLQPGKRYEAVFQCRADRAGSFRMVVAQGTSPWTEFFGRIVNVGIDWQTVRCPFTVPKETEGTLHMPRIMCADYGTAATLYFGPVILREIPKQLPLALNKEWTWFRGTGAFDKLPVQSGTTVELNNDIIDLAPLAQYRFHSRESAMMYNRFESREAGVMSVGFAADWYFELYLNGKKLYDTLSKGNGTQDFLPDAHIVELPVKAGENLLAVRVLAGSGGWKFACGKPTFAPRGTVIHENADWKPFEIPRRVESGSILDFSRIGLHDAPAGKHGRVIINSKGNFAFESAPENPVRFFGTNLYFELNFPDREQAEQLADLLVSCGYNAVRLHHFDYILSGGVKDNYDLTRINPEKLERFDYLFKCLKERGVYLTLDLNTVRTKAMKKSMWELLFNPRERQNFLTFAGNLLNHVNPHTGIAWKDDPALTMISALNEDTPFFYMGHGGKTPQPILDRVEKEIAEKNLTPTAHERQVLVEKAVVAAQAETFPPIRDALRAMGVKAPQTDQNVWSSVAMALIRKDLDYVDNHFYWDHPNYSADWKLPLSISNQSAVARFIGNNSPFFLPSPFAARILGKPYTITEFNFCYPNQFRAEGGALMGAYASLQGWDAIYRYGFSGNLKGLEKDYTDGATFDTLNDVMKLLSDRLAALLFLRGDVTTSELVIPIAVPENYLDSKSPWRLSRLGSGGLYPPVQSSLGFVAGVGSVVGNAAGISLQADTFESDAEMLSRLELGKGRLDLAHKYAGSSTGELVLDGERGFFTVATSRSCAAVFTKPGRLAAGILEIENKKSSATVSFSALDDKTLPESQRILGLHLTNAYQNKMTFSDRSMSVLESHGELPRLARRGTADVILRLHPGTSPVVYGTDLAGKRLGKIASEFDSDGVLRFTMDTFTFDTPCFVYEIIR